MHDNDTYSPYIYADPNTLSPRQQARQRADRLTFLLDKSTIYAKIIGDRMARQQIEKAKAEKRAATRKENKEKKGEVSAVGTKEGLRGKKKVDEEKDEEKNVNGKRKRKSDVTANGKKAKVEVDESVSCPCPVPTLGADKSRIKSTRNPRSRPKPTATPMSSTRTSTKATSSTRLLSLSSSPEPSCATTNSLAFNG